MPFGSRVRGGGLDLRDHPGVVDPIEAENVDLDARHPSIAGDDVNTPAGEFLRGEILAQSPESVRPRGPVAVKVSFS